MAKLIILRGLPASGKSTWARSWCEDPANTWPHCVISLDDIRLMIAGSAQVRNRLQSEHGKRFNDMVVAMGRHMIADALDAGWDVVADAQHGPIGTFVVLITVARPCGSRRVGLSFLSRGK